MSDGVSMCMAADRAAALFAVFVRGIMWRKHFLSQNGREHHYGGAVSKYKLGASNYIF